MNRLNAILYREFKMRGLDVLVQLDFEQRRRRYASVPLAAITRPRFNDRKSNSLTQAILRWLELKGHYCVRVNTTGRKLKDTVIVDVIGRAHVTPGQWIPGTTRRGTADLHASINGRHVSIEVKVGKDRISEDQMKTKQLVESSGALYYIARDFESFFRWYNTLTNTT